MIDIFTYLTMKLCYNNSTGILVQNAVFHLAMSVSFIEMDEDVCQVCRLISDNPEDYLGL